MMCAITFCCWIHKIRPHHTYTHMHAVHKDEGHWDSKPCPGGSSKERAKPLSTPLRLDLPQARPEANRREFGGHGDRH